MLKQSMRDKLVALTGRTLDAGDTATLDELLDGAYQFTIPGMLTGESTEGEWTITTVASTGEYAYPAWFLSAFRKNPLLKVGTTTTRRLSYFTFPERFWYRYDRDSTQEGEPQSLLFYGRTAYVRPIPSAVYTIRVFGRVGDSNPIPASGIDDRDHAMTVVAQAALEHAQLTGNGEVLSAAERLNSKHFSNMQTRSLARGRGRRAQRTF